MMKTLLLVDGSNLLFQMFYGMPSRIVNHDGIAIQGVIGFLGALRKIIAMTEPTHIGVFFDGECQNERKTLDADYKANRPSFEDTPEEELPFAQQPYIESALDLLGIRHKETDSCEVDDWIAAYVATFRCDIRIVIASFDSDFFQLVSDTVSVLRYRGNATALVTSDVICEKFGITPSQYADFKSLVGDTADNIKGIRGIGAKTASALLAAYGSLDRLFENLQGVTPPRLRASLEEGVDRLTLNRALITLTGNVPIPYALDELAYRHVPFGTTELLLKLGLQKPRE